MKMPQVKQFVSLLVIDLDPSTNLPLEYRHKNSLKPVGVRCVDVNRKFFDVSIEKFPASAMKTLWHLQKEQLVSHEGQLLTKREYQSGEHMRDASHERDTIESIHQLIKYDEKGLSPDGKNKKMFIQVIGFFWTLDGRIRHFEGFASATNRLTAEKAARTYYNTNYSANLSMLEVSIVRFGIGRSESLDPEVDFHQISLTD